MYKVSIVIPIYNAENYLEEALESIVNQTEDNLEIICIDDGSTDNSAEIMDDYAVKYNNIVVIHKPNSGYGDTVNKGIEISHGEYIGILEPDDYVSLNMYEILYDTAEKYKLDWVKGNYACFWNNSKERKVEYGKIVSDEDYYNKILKPSEDRGIFRGVIMNPSGIYKKSFLDKFNIWHNNTPGASYQDIGFWYQVMTKSERGMLLDDTLYYYRQDNSASSMNNRSKIYCVCDEYSYLRNMIKQEPNSILTLCMYATYSFTYKQRIAIEYRKDFLERYKKDFMSLIRDGVYDDSMLLDNEKEEISSIINNTNIYYVESMRLSTELTKLLNSVNEFLIYGAGFFAKKICHELPMDIREKQKGFIVTNENHEKELMGKAIFSVNELRRKKYDVVIGVTEKYKSEVLSILEHYQTNSVIIIDEELGKI